MFPPNALCQRYAYRIDARMSDPRRIMDGMVSIERLLDFEAAHPTWSGKKEDAITAELGLRPARYWQLLHRAVMTREAVEHDPMTTHRILRRLAA